MKSILLTAVACLMFTPATAQSTKLDSSPSGGAQMGTGSKSTATQGPQIDFIKGREAGLTGASDMLGQYVYGQNNEEVAQVWEVLFNNSGQVQGIVLEGGAFSSGNSNNSAQERYIAVPLNALQIEERTRAAQTKSATGRTAADGTNSSSAPNTGSGAPARETASSANTGAAGAGGTAATAGARDAATKDIAATAERSAREANKTADATKRSAESDGQDTGLAADYTPAESPIRISIRATREQLLAAPEFHDDTMAATPNNATNPSGAQPGARPPGSQSR
jgi:hypothetical protein